MKKTIIALIALAILLISVGCQLSDTIRVGDPEHPFVVSQVTQLDSMFSNYLGQKTHNLIMPSGMYNIGDTVNLFSHAVANRMVPIVLRGGFRESPLDSVYAIDSVKIRDGLLVGIVDGTLIINYDNNRLFGVK